MFKVLRHYEVEFVGENLVKIADRRGKYDAEWLIILREKKLSVHMEGTTFLLVYHVRIEECESFDFVPDLLLDVLMLSFEGIWGRLYA